MKVGSCPTDLLVNTGMTHSTVSQHKDPFSQRHATIVRAIKDQTSLPFLISKKCGIGKHEVRHEFFCLPDCFVAFMVITFLH
jgi:hypothetical protein